MPRLTTGRVTHTSAGRLPTEIGLRLFVDGLLEVGRLTTDERANIDSHCQATGKSVAQLLQEATETLSGLSHCAGLVLAPKTEQPLRQVEFVSLGEGRALVVLVTQDGQVENRIIEAPLGLPPIRPVSWLGSCLGFSSCTSSASSSLNCRVVDLARDPRTKGSLARSTTANPNS